MRTKTAPFVQTVVILDVAIATPRGREPIVITVFTKKNDPEAKYDDAVVAAAARIVLKNLD